MKTHEPEQLDLEAIDKQGGFHTLEVFDNPPLASQPASDGAPETLETEAA